MIGQSFKETKQELEYLRSRNRLLNCLKEAGVNN